MRALFRNQGSARYFGFESFGFWLGFWVQGLGFGCWSFLVCFASRAVASGIVLVSHGPSQSNSPRL